MAYLHEMKKLAAIILTGVLAGCAAKPSHQGETAIEAPNSTNQTSDQPDPTREPWRDASRAFPSAKAGNPEGLRKYFAAARAQLMQPYINSGEESEAIMENMIAILQSVGDRQFADALLNEEAETRSAVREFLIEEDTRAHFSRTHSVLASAPVVKWPSDIAEAESYISSGSAPPTKKQWSLDLGR